MEVREGPCLCGQPERMGEDSEGKPVLIRCPLYQRLYVNKEDGTKEEEWKCAIAWIPILLIENAGEVKTVARYVESFRNETIGRIDQARRSVVARQSPDLILEAHDAAPQ